MYKLFDKCLIFYNICVVDVSLVCRLWNDEPAVLKRVFASLCAVGEQLLQAGEVFSLRPLQLYSVSQQLRLAKPTCCNGDAKTDLGHILDFACRLRYLKVAQLWNSRPQLCTSNWWMFSLVLYLLVGRSLVPEVQLEPVTSRRAVCPLTCPFLNHCSR